MTSSRTWRWPSTTWPQACAPNRSCSTQQMAENDRMLLQPDAGVGGQAVPRGRAEHRRRAPGRLRPLCHPRRLRRLRHRAGLTRVGRPAQRARPRASTWPPSAPGVERVRTLRSGYIASCGLVGAAGRPRPADRSTSPRRWRLPWRPVQRPARCRRRAPRRHRHRLGDQRTGRRRGASTTCGGTASTWRTGPVRDEHGPASTSARASTTRCATPTPSTAVGTVQVKNGEQPVWRLARSGTMDDVTSPALVRLGRRRRHRAAGRDHHPDRAAHVAGPPRQRDGRPGQPAAYLHPAAGRSAGAARPDAQRHRGRRRQRGAGSSRPSSGS